MLKREKRLMPETWQPLALTLVMGAVLLYILIHISYIGFSYYWDNMHSDIAGDLAFVREAASQRSLFPSGWHHLQEMRLVHITTVMIPIYWITGNINLTYPIAATLMLFVNVFLFWWMLAYKKRPLLPILIGLTVLLAVFSRYAMFSVFSILFVNGSLSVPLSVIFLTLGCYLRIKHREKPLSRLSYVGFGAIILLGFAMGIQSNRMMMALYIPLLIAEFISLSVRGLEDKNFRIQDVPKTTWFVLCLFAANIFGIFVINRLISAGVVMVEYGLVTRGLRMPAFADGLWDRLERIAHEALSSVGLRGDVGAYTAGGFAQVGRIGFLVVLAILWFKMFRGREASENHLVRTLFISVIALKASMLLFATGIGERFMFTTTAMIALVAVIIADHFVGQKRQVLTAMLCTVCIVMSLLSMSILGVQRNENLIADRQAVVDFIMDRGYTIGYGTFWQGPVLSAKADFAFTVIPVRYHVMRPFPHGVTSDTLYHTEDRVFFVLSTGAENTARETAGGSAVLDQGERHEFPRGWIVYTFEENPFRRTAASFV